MEHGADFFDPGDDEGNYVVEPASMVVTANHDPGRDDGGPLGRRVCWSGWEVVGDHPEPTWRTPMRHDTATAGGGVSGAVTVMGEPAIKPDAPFPALECCGGKATLGLPCQVSTNGMSSIPTLSLTGNSVDGLHHPWIFVGKSCIFVGKYCECRHGKCQMLVTARHSTACHRGGAPPHHW